LNEREPDDCSLKLTFESPQQETRSSISYRRDNLNFWTLTTPTVTAILFNTKPEQLLTVIDNVCQEFRWQPVANESMLDVYRAWLSMKVDERPQLIITSSAAVSQS